jgi:hypothetical protein
MNISEVGNLAAEFMEQLERQYDSENVKIGVVGLVVELNFNRPEGESTVIQYMCSDPRRWVQAGIFDTAKRCVIDSSTSVE